MFDYLSDAIAGRGLGTLFTELWLTRSLLSGAAKTCAEFEVREPSRKCWCVALFMRWVAGFACILLNFLVSQTLSCPSTTASLRSADASGISTEVALTHTLLNQRCVIGAQNSVGMFVETSGSLNNSVSSAGES